jgi:predicted nucleotidyltransferase
MTMNRPDAVAVARALVVDRYPNAEQAWLGGSVVTGCATETSDLDITVLDESASAHRESIRYQDWPVELFVHTTSSIRFFVDQDLAQRKPTMARLVAEGIPLIAGEGGDAIRHHCERVLATGPGPLTPDEADVARYALSDLIDDLRGGTTGAVGTAIAVETWRRSADLILGGHGHWAGGGKWLMRELIHLDEHLGTTWTTTLDGALRSALLGDARPLHTVAEAALSLLGGRLWEGFSQAAPAEVGKGIEDGIGPYPVPSAGEAAGLRATPRGRQRRVGDEVETWFSCCSMERESERPAATPETSRYGKNTGKR